MAMLPEEFSDLEPFAAKWSLATERERYAARLSSSMDEMQAFYDAAFVRTRHDGRRKRMLTHLLETRRPRQQRAFVDAGRCFDGHERRPSLGERSRLVHDERRDPFEHLEGLCVAKHHANLGGMAGADHD